MYNIEGSTPSLNLTESSRASLVDSIESGHSYNTRLSAKLKACRLKLNFGSQNPLFRTSLANETIEKTLLNDTEVGLLTPKHILTKTKGKIVSVDSQKGIMPRACQPLMACNRNPSCLEKLFWYMIFFLAMVASIALTTYVIQGMRSSESKSYYYLNDEISKIKEQMVNMKTEVQDVFTSKDDTEKKLEVIEQLLQDLKQTVQKSSENSNPKCPAYRDRDTKSKSIEKEIGEALDIYADDKTGKTDFALEFTGGSIIEVRDTESYPAPDIVKFWGVAICTKANSARAILQPGTLPGECWAFKGSRGCAIIRLLGKVRITGVTLEHISPSMSPSGEITTAPKDFTIKGLNSIEDLHPQLLGKFTYDINGKRLQYFEVANCDKSFNIIEFKVLSNHGHPDFTCVYRLRVHGKLQ